MMPSARLHLPSDASGATSGAPSRPASDAPRASVHLVSLLLAFVGFCVSIYALIEHLRLKSGATTLGCDINDTVSCSTVFNSSYGAFAGIPLGAFGMAYFGIVAATAVLPKFADVSERWISWWRMIVAAVGTAVSLVLAYVSYFQLGAVCVVCSGIHAITIVNFVATLLGFVRHKAGLNFAEPTAFLKLVSTSLALGVPPLVAGLILPSLNIGAAKPSTAETTQTPSTAATPFPANLTGFAKSDFVGKGQDYRKGNDEAKVVLQMFSDLECPHCKSANDGILQALSVVGEDKVLFVYRNYPLSNRCNPGMSSEGHKHACDLALASRCAGQQGKFWEYKEWAFSGIEMSPGEKESSFSTDGLKAQASRLGLNAGRFAECLDAKVELPKIQDDISVGNQLGLSGTPLLILNGKKYTGPISAQGFISALQGEIALAGN
jgi:uncharacterized membrane protein/predicted DsbA family dithiol-disulfide isomerase